MIQRQLEQLAKDAKSKKTKCQETMATQSWVNEFLPLGHRPPGTQEACVDMANGACDTEGQGIQMRTCVLCSIALFQSMDDRSDQESVAQSDHDPEARASKKARRAQAKGESN